MHRSIFTDVQMYRFAKVTVYLGFAFIVTIFDIFKLITDYQVDHQIFPRPFETGGHFQLLQRNITFPMGIHNPLKHLKL